jgi:NTP pyrophosphatase (non-canonical NTP hydrolase)
MGEREKMEHLKQVFREFNEERDWDQFHSPENLAKSISIEAGELLECFQWDNNYDKEHLCEELADVLSYCIMLADYMTKCSETLQKMDEIDEDSLSAAEPLM